MGAMTVVPGGGAGQRTVDELAGEIRAGAVRLAAATAAWLRLVARDGGCVRPGCTETRIERLHAHHLRPWRLGGRTDVSRMVQLCDVDHGLVHDEGTDGLGHVVWALLVHRDHVRRLAA